VEVGDRAVGAADRGPGLRVAPFGRGVEDGRARVVGRGAGDPSRGCRQEAAEAGYILVQAGRGAGEVAASRLAVAPARLAQVLGKGGEGGIARRGGAVPGTQRGEGARQNRRDLGFRDRTREEGADGRGEGGEQEDQQRRDQRRRGETVPGQRSARAPGARPSTRISARPSRGERVPLARISARPTR